MPCCQGRRPVRRYGSSCIMPPYRPYRCLTSFMLRPSGFSRIVTAGPRQSQLRGIRGVFVVLSASPELPRRGRLPHHIISNLPSISRVKTSDAGLEKEKWKSRITAFSTAQSTLHFLDSAYFSRSFRASQVKSSISVRILRSAGIGRSWRFENCANSCHE